MVTYKHIHRPCTVLQTYTSSADKVVERDISIATTLITKTLSPTYYTYLNTSTSNVEGLTNHINCKLANKWKFPLKP
jgi:hypothetical protein